MGTAPFGVADLHRLPAEAVDVPAHEVALSGVAHGGQGVVGTLPALQVEGGGVRWEIRFAR